MTHDGRNMQGAAVLVQVLLQSGVSHIFGLPGDTGMAFYDALHRERSRLRHIMSRDERSASFMADVYARASGRLGVCEGPSGGGATYIVPGVAEAQGSAIPLLCLTTDTPVSQQGMGVLTELDQESLFRPVTKWTTRVNSTQVLGDTVRRAIRQATTGRPGAVHLSLPADILEASAAENWGDPIYGAAPALRTRPDPALISAAAELIERSERPVIVAGGGVLISGAWDALTNLAETLNIPVATSINGKGSIAETSPVAIGVVGGNGARSYTNQVVGDADLVIFVGTRTESTTTHHWTVPARRPGPSSIHIDIEPREIGNSYRATVPVLGDAKLVLEDLFAAIDRSQAIASRNRPRIEDLQRRSADYWATVCAEAADMSSPIKPQRLVAEMRARLDDETVIVADPGTPTPYLSAQYELRRAGRTTIIPRAHGGLGYAIPGVVGAAIARPESRVIGMCGDGSFGMSCGELETISRLNLPIVLIQCSNGTFGWIKELQHLYHGQRYYSVDFNTVDYAAIARGFGLQARHVTDPAEVGPALDAALADGRPYFLDVVTEPPMTETPPVAGWQEAARRESQEAHVP